MNQRDAPPEKQHVEQTLGGPMKLPQLPVGSHYLCIDGPIGTMG